MNVLAMDDHGNERPAKNLKQPRWWFGGVSSTTAVLFSHPMDTLKVALQTAQQESTIWNMFQRIYGYSGLRGLYNGLSAAVMRQMLSTGSRIALFDLSRPHVNLNSFYKKALLAASTGFVGTFVGYPADVINVRMQSDSRLSPENRRVYKNVIHGIYTVYKTEGFCQLYSGSFLVACKGMVVSVCSIAVYEEAKQMFRESGFEDSDGMFFCSSMTAAIVSTSVVQPMDIIKTRIMEDSKKKYNGPLDVIKKLYKTDGLTIFFRGYPLNFIRICPHTVVTFMMMEQLRMRWGYLPQID